jgi:hypothetical protein
MRTTIDLPDDLLRRAKAAAALSGVKLKDLMTQFVEEGLKRRAAPPEVGHRRPIPVVIPRAGRQIPVLSNSELLGVLDQEEDSSGE